MAHSLGQLRPVDVTYFARVRSRALACNSMATIMVVRSTSLQCNIGSPHTTAASGRLP